MQIAKELVMFWALAITRNRMFSRTKWLLASMLGTLNGCGLRSLALKRVLHCKVEFRGADRIVVAASMLWIATLVNARQCLQIAVELLCQGDAV